MKHTRILFILLFIFSPILVRASTDSIFGLFFTTDVRQISAGQISEAITIQSQNSTGAPEKVDETNDITFVSSSNTGEFLGSTGNPVTTTMSKNTSSRTFYYRDSTEGEHTLTVTIKGRDTGKEFTTSQKIFIGDNYNTDENVNQNEDTDQSDDEEDVSIQSSSDNSSTHSSQSVLSTYKKKVKLSLDAGRKRTVTVNTPIDFVAYSNKDSGSLENKYIWSFGDGSSISGKEATHTYMFPGDYIVVLNAFDRENDGPDNAVARTEVKVVVPEVVLLSAKSGSKGYVDIKNNSKNEINIGGWILNDGENNMVLARDTILKGKMNIRVPISFKKYSENISLYYPNTEIFSTISYDNIDNGLADSEKEKVIVEMIKQIEELKSKVSLEQSSVSNTNEDVVQKQDKGQSNETSTVLIPDEKVDVPIIDNIDQEALLIDSLKEDNSGLHIPIPTFIRKIFK